MLLKDPQVHVFIHGFDAYNYTAVFALLVWYFVKQTESVNFHPLEALKDLYGEDLACDFPSYERHREQLLEIIEKSKTDILSAFTRGTFKKPKISHEQQQPEDGGD
jgi:hypothetical protein